MVPFDWKTPFGYLVAWVFEAVSIGSITIAITTTLCLVFASSCLFVAIATDDMSQNLTNFHADLNTSRRHDQEELMERFCEIIRTFSSTKEYEPYQKIWCEKTLTKNETHHILGL